MPTDGMKIQHDVSFKPGVYYLPRGVEIANHQLTVDGNGAVLIGEKYQWRGVAIRGVHNATVRNLTLQAYGAGIFLWKVQTNQIGVELAQITETKVSSNRMIDNILEDLIELS